MAVKNHTRNFAYIPFVHKNTSGPMRPSIIHIREEKVQLRLTKYNLFLLFKAQVLLFRNLFNKLLKIQLKIKP